MEIKGSSSTKEGEETSLHVQISNTCVFDINNVITECNDDVLSLLEVTHSAVRVVEIPSLAAEPRNGPDCPFPCSGPEDSASITSQQLSLCVTGQLAGTF